MRRNIYISIGAFFILLLLTSFFVFKVFGSESLISVSGCTPYNVKIVRGGVENSVEISWESKQRCSGYILYGSEMKDLDMVGIDLGNDIESKKHTVLLQSLISSKRYYFGIVSESMTYGKEGLPLQFSIDSL